MKSSVKLKVVLGFIGITILYAVIVGSFLLDAISGLPFWQQFLIATVPIYLFPSIVIGQFIGKDGLKKTAGSFLLITAIDTIVPPYLIGLDGVFADAMLNQASVDVFFASILSGVGVSGFLLYLGTYVLVPVSLMVVSVLLLTDSQLIKALKQ